MPCNAGIPLLPFSSERISHWFICLGAYEKCLTAFWQWKWNQELKLGLKSYDWDKFIDIPRRWFTLSTWQMNWLNSLTMRYNGMSFNGEAQVSGQSQNNSRQAKQTARSRPNSKQVTQTIKSFLLKHCKLPTARGTWKHMPAVWAVNSTANNPVIRKASRLYTWN